jgi:hypothetical protein
MMVGCWPSLERVDSAIPDRLNSETDAEPLSGDNQIRSQAPLVYTIQHSDQPAPQAAFSVSSTPLDSL